MKKLFYILVLTLVTSFSISSCTEESVEPRKADNNGGSASDPLEKV
jgi:hypothetical protein